MKNRLSFLSFLLSVCILLSMCTSCSTIDLNAEIEAIYAEIGEIIKQAIRQKWDDMTGEILQTWEETFQIIDDGITEKIQTTIHPYEKVSKQEWEPVFTSYIGDEELVISRRHGRGFLAVHCTTYLVEIYENGVCTHYSVHTNTPCPQGGWAKCEGGMATLDTAVANNESGVLTEIYPYLQDVYVYLTLRRIQSNEISYEEFQASLVDGVFNQVMQSQYAGIMDGAMGDATGAGVSLAGDAMGEILETENFLSAIWDVGGTVKDAADNYRLAQDTREAAYHYDPAVKLMEENWNTILVTVTAPLYQQLAMIGYEQSQWVPANGEDAFTLNGSPVQLRANEASIQWRYPTDDSEWTDLEPLDKIKRDNVEVLLQVQDDTIVWKYALNDTELVLAVAQQALHDKAKQVTYAVN